MGATPEEEAEIRRKVELELRVKYLERENEDQKNRIEELHAMIVSMNETIANLEQTVNSVAEPLNNDIRALKEFSQDFKNIKSRVIGGVVVLSIVFGALWGVVGPAISKLLSAKLGGV